MSKEKWACADCGYVSAASGRPSLNTCPGCRGDFTWEKVAQQLRPYMSDEEAETATAAVREVLYRGSDD